MQRNIFDGIEALAALERFGTVSEAATRLRLTQSAVSKRIQALQRAMGFVVVVPDGRRLRLTDDAAAFLERARPLLAELREIASPRESAGETTFSLGLADSIAASWGPRVLARALQDVPDVKVELHAHRSVLLIESIRLGRYHIGLTTSVPTGTDLVQCTIIEEPMALVRSGLERSPAGGRAGSSSARGHGSRTGSARGSGATNRRPAKTTRRSTVPAYVPLITIEPGSATWGAIAAALQEHHPEIAKREMVPVETFSAVLQMVRAGFGDGLVPLGIAIEAGLGPASFRTLPRIQRRVSLLTRKTIHQLDSYGRLRDALLASAAQYFARGRARPRRSVSATGL